MSGKVVSTSFKGASDTSETGGAKASAYPVPSTVEQGEVRKAPPRHHGHTNPYNRPLSAKDLANISPQYKMPVKKQYHGQSGSRRDSTSSGASDVSPSSNPTSLQTNSFMRPQSGLRKEERKHKNSTPSSVLFSEIDRLAETLGSQTTTENSSSGKDACKALIEIGSLVSGMTSTGSERTVRRTDAPTGEMHTVAAVPSLCSDLSSADGSQQLSCTCQSRSETSVSSRGSSTHQSSSNSDCCSNVRNPNYTPTKPYSMVKEGRRTKPDQTSQPVLSLNQANPSLASPPLEVKHALQFYRKGSKSHEQLHEHGIRLKGDGAPAASALSAMSKDAGNKLTQSSGTLSANDNDSSDWGSPSG